MARRTEDEVEAVVNDEQETVAEGTETATQEKAPKAKKEPARGELPEGYVTPVGLTKLLNEKGLHKNRAGEVVEIRPQMTYSYIKNAPKDAPFPMEKVTDSLGKERDAVKVDAALEWWEAKNKRAAERKANAADKATKKAAKAAEKEAQAADSNEAESAEVVEAE